MNITTSANTVFVVRFAHSNPPSADFTNTRNVSCNPPARLKKRFTFQKDMV